MVPAISVNSPIVQVGIASDGSQADGTSITRVYHWRQGVTPGERGSAVLDGHTCHFSCTHGVFQDLAKLHVGNRAKTRIGTKLSTFKVTRVLRHLKHRSSSWWAALYDDTGPSRLVLVTCGDPSDKDGKYHSRTVVFLKRIHRS